MRPASKMALLLTAIALPIGAVAASFALTDEPRAPQVPGHVEVRTPDGTAPPSGGGAPDPSPSSTTRPNDLPPPPPADDDADDDRFDDDQSDD